MLIATFDVCDSRCDRHQGRLQSPYPIPASPPQNAISHGSHASILYQEIAVLRVRREECRSLSSCSKLLVTVRMRNWCKWLPDRPGHAICPQWALFPCYDIPFVLLFQSIHAIAMANRTRSTHSPSSRQRTGTSSARASCCIATTSRPTSSSTSRRSSCARSGVPRSRFRRDRGRRAFEEGSVRSPVVNSVVSNDLARPLSLLLTKTSFRHRSPSVGLLQLQPLHDR